MLGRRTGNRAKTEPIFIVCRVLYKYPHRYYGNVLSTAKQIQLCTNPLPNPIFYIFFFTIYYRASDKLLKYAFTEQVVNF